MVWFLRQASLEKLFVVYVAYNTCRMRYPFFAIILIHLYTEIEINESF